MTNEWDETIRGVKKLNKNIAKAPLPKKEIVISKEFEGIALTSKNYDDLVASDTSGIDRKTAQKMDRGELRPDIEIDLHGLTREDAFSRVKNVISQAFVAGKRMVLIITGKGVKTEYKSVLRDELPAWLNHESIRPMIVRYSQAAIKDGGSGAFYVLIRRQR
ncbi:MAG: Smr/MutS family protein [Rickettsiales bacterium]